MCGRYVGLDDDDYEELHSIINEVSKKFNKAEAARGEVFPSSNIPVVYSYHGKNILSNAKWGFPSFQNKGIIINARSETAAEKPMFRDSFITKRCIIPANGYYEWLTHEDKKKTKYLIGLKEKGLLHMAGLYNLFTDKNGIVYAAATIITTNANSDIAFIHDRMPAILQQDFITTWLDEDNRDPVLLKSLLVPYKVGEIKFEAA